MNFPFFIAKRYLFSRHTTNAVNILTGISLLGVAVGAAAMIVVLSGFNGLENLIRGFYNTFDPDLKAELVVGKTFKIDSTKINKIHALEPVNACSFILEEKALFRFQNKEFIATLKGVDENYLNVTHFEKGLVAGEFFPPGTDENLGILGMGVAYHLGISKINYQTAIELYVPRSDASITNPNNAISNYSFFPVGLFSVQPEFDVKYTIVPIDFARSLTNQPNKASSIEIDLDSLAEVDEVKQEIQAILGENFNVLNRNEQQKEVFKVLQSEGFMTYLVLAFIVMIASFGILGSNTMLVIDKREDIKTLWHMGANEKLIKRIFFTEGIITSLLGGLSGITLGVLIVLAQQQWGLVSIGENYIVDAYPVTLKIDDLILVLSTVVILGLVSSAISTLRLKLKNL